MDFQFSKLIEDINVELEAEYVGGAYRWMDEEKDGAFSKAQDRFEKILQDAIRLKNFNYARHEGIIYRDTLIELLQEYKRSRQISDADSFLNSISGGLP